MSTKLKRSLNGVKSWLQSKIINQFQTLIDVMPGRHPGKQINVNIRNRAIRYTVRYQYTQLKEGWKQFRDVGTINDLTENLLGRRIVSAAIAERAIILFLQTICLFSFCCLKRNVAAQRERFSMNNFERLNR